MSHGPTLVMFDPMVVWRDLLPEERDRIGAAALAYGAALNVANYVDEATGHDENALEVAAMALEEAVEDAAFFFVARRSARDARCAARRASADYVDPDPNGIPDLRGGWGDSYEASLLGSRLWQLNRSKITDATTPLPARLAPLARFHEQRRIDGRQGVRVMPGVTDPFAETNRRVSLIDARRSAVIAEAERMVYEGMSEGRWRRLCSAVLGLRELSIKPGPTTPPHANSNFEGGTKA